jgi:hypothetical protein
VAKVVSIHLRKALPEVAGRYGSRQADFLFGDGMDKADVA